MTLDQILQAAGYGATAIGGGAATELLRWYLHRGERASDDAAEIRSELRTDKAELRAEVDKLRSDITKQQEEYSTLLKKHEALSLSSARLEGHVQALSDENTKLRTENLNLKGENSELRTRLEIFQQILDKLSKGGAEQAAQTSGLATGTGAKPT